MKCIFCSLFTLFILGTERPVHTHGKIAMCENCQFSHMENCHFPLVGVCAHTVYILPFTNDCLWHSKLWASIVLQCSKYKYSAHLICMMIFIVCKEVKRGSENVLQSYLPTAIWDSPSQLSLYYTLKKKKKEFTSPKNSILTAFQKLFFTSVIVLQEIVT